MPLKSASPVTPPMRQRPALRARFGSSGIRGGLDTVDVRLGLALGRVLGEQYPSLIVGHDARLSGPALTNAVIAGALSSGADVHDAGLVPTPVIAHAAREYDLGVMVTASHNPAPDNGYKLITPQGTAPLPTETKRIEERLNDPPPPVDWNTTGTRHPAPGVGARYIQAVMDHLHDGGFEAGSLEGFRIALDCAHGAATTITPRILSRLGASLTVLGGTPDGRFPDHPSEPTAENLTRLRHVMQDGEHILGIAHDGDADRTVFVAPGGELIRPEQLLVVLARRRGDTRVVVPVDSGGLIATALPDTECIITPVGDIHLSQAILDQRATLGAEPSGTWWLNDWSAAPEGPYVAALVAAHLAHDPDLVMEATGLPLPARAMRKVPLDGEADMEVLIEAITERLSKRLDPLQVMTIDGVRLETEQGWILVRKSGTEPVMRITAEADTPDHAEALAQEAANQIHETRRAITSRGTP